MKNRSKQLTKFIYLLVTLSIISGCSKRDKDPYYGIDTIDNVLYGAGPYFPIGFSFEIGEAVSTMEVPGPDITVHANVDINGSITGKYIDSPNNLESFALVEATGSSEEAKSLFNDLLEVGNRTWEEIAADIDEDQVWLFKTSLDNYVKFRIIEIVTDNAQRPPYVQMKFEWRIQPDGSTTFIK